MWQQEMSNTLYDAPRGLSDPPAEDVEERGLESAMEAAVVQLGGLGSGGSARPVRFRWFGSAAVSAG